MVRKERIVLNATPAAANDASSPYLSAYIEMVGAEGIPAVKTATAKS